MKKVQSILAAALLITTTAFAQESVVSTSGSVNDVYYSMANGDVKSVSNTNWDLAFEMTGYTGSILINGQKGNKLFVSPFAVADWANFDTTGYMSWSENINSLTTWSVGAFSQNPTSDFDLGWGQYDINTHTVKGDSIFLLQLSGGSFKKIYIKNLATGNYTFVYADLDGSNEQTKVVSKADYIGQNFGYFTFDGETGVSREPSSEEWDIVFTKYISLIPIGGGQFMNYPVAGVKINKGVQVAERSGVNVSDNDTMNLNWDTDITTIGSDWKSFDGSQYVITADLSYFLRLANGDVWKIYFTNYEGGSAGKYYFTKELIKSSSVQNGLTADIRIYPNPAANSDIIQLDVPIGLEVLNVTAITASGQIIYGSFENGAISFNQNLTPGLYHLQINTSAGSIQKNMAIR
ncbi:MAG: T9SS type A sorting domain-containing protein [Bacteroidetes bacterium]|nr:T9SS type A sorting domain-containing protein [Bacteroidota bacterium]